MNPYDGKPYQLDYLYFRVSGDKRIYMVPLCEAFVNLSGAVIDSKQSTEVLIVLVEQKENGKSYKFTKDEFQAILQNLLYGDNKARIIDFVVQPEGELMTHGVTTFLEHYQF